MVIKSYKACLALMLSWTLVIAPVSAFSDTPKSAPIIVGMEYAYQNGRAPYFKDLATLGAGAIKPVPENFNWDKMQPTPTSPIDFRMMDDYVKTFQAAGFKDIVLALRCIHVIMQASPGSPVPKPEYMALYEKWISSIVERYDKDGVGDMPGLLYPIRIYEIGVEFSTYEPEPVDQYLNMLEHAYKAAHTAYPNVMIAHVAFLTTLALKDHPTTGPEYEQAFKKWAQTYPFGRVHTLEEMRKILDRPDIFDVVNFHALNDPDEIVDTMKWLKWEMQQRKYSKPIIVSDTIPEMFVAWGAATKCGLNPLQMGTILWPAIENDRCRLADYFTKLVSNDQAAVAWTQGFVASDTVKKVITAAEQGVMLINTSYMEDLVQLKWPVFNAGAGTSAWAGMVELGWGWCKKRAGYYALGQTLNALRNYDSVTRITKEFDGTAIDPRLHIYQIIKKDGHIGWVAWFDPGYLVLPGDPVPTYNLTCYPGGSSITVEPMIFNAGQSQPTPYVIKTPQGAVTITFSPYPVFVTRPELVNAPQN